MLYGEYSGISYPLNKKVVASEQNHNMAKRRMSINEGDPVGIYLYRHKNKGYYIKFCIPKGTKYYTGEGFHRDSIILAAQVIRVED